MRLNSGSIHRLAGLAAFKANWLLLVAGQRDGAYWALAVLALQLWLCLPPSLLPAVRRAAAVVAVGSAGIALDTTLMTAGVLQFDAGRLPLSLCLLWFAFACAIAQFTPELRRLSLRGLGIVSSCAGVAGYGAGLLLGAVGFGIEAWQALLLIAVLWCAVLPLACGIFGLADSPGRRGRRAVFLLPALVMLAAVPEGAEADDVQEWRRLGEGRHSFLLQPLYTARLEARTDRFNFPDTAPFRLTLRYHLPVKPERILDATRDEWRKQGIVAPQHWLTALRDALPVLARDDELTLHVDAGYRAELLHNGVLLARFDDADFTRAFAGIWLDEKTSAPRLRRQLLGADG